MSYPAFHARAPWWGGDLQTLRNFLRPARRDLGRFPPERVLLPLRDGTGDALVGTLQRPAELAAKRPLVVLIHGMAGDETSPYLLTTAGFLLGRGYPVMRLNLRGAGPSREHCRLLYHAGRSEDLRQAILSLPPDLAGAGVLLVGFSLGGNVLLKFAAESASALPVLGVVSISAPIDLMAASRRFHEPRNRIYCRHMVQSLKRECLAAGDRLRPHEVEAVRRARSVVEFDDGFVAPRNGFRDAADYYEQCGARRFLGAIRVPALVIHALDDPWIPGGAYTSYPWAENPHLVPLLPPRGGHVGFHGRGTRVPWHDRCTGVFFDELLGKEADSRVGLRAARRSRA